MLPAPCCILDLVHLPTLPTHLSVWLLRFSTSSPSFSTALPESLPQRNLVHDTMSVDNEIKGRLALITGASGGYELLECT